MGLFSDLFGEKTETESRARTDPWIGAVGPLVESMGLIGQFGRQPLEYTGPTGAAITPAQEQARAGLLGLAGTMQGGYMQPAAEAFRGALGAPQAVLGMGLQDVAANPALAGIADVMAARSERQMLEEVLPQMRASAVSGGQLGGSRLAVEAQQAERDRQLALNEALAGLYGGAWEAGLGAETSRYQQALAAQQGAMGQLPMMMGQAQAPFRLMEEVGGMQRTEAQRALDEEAARRQFAQMEPYTRGTMTSQAVMPAATAFATGEAQQTQESQPSVIGAMGQLASIAGSLMGGLGGFGGFGGMGGGGGGFMPSMGGSFGGYGSPGMMGGWGTTPFGIDPWTGRSYSNPAATSMWY